jgi:hypothetical protein
MCTFHTYICEIHIYRFTILMSSFALSLSLTLYRYLVYRCIFGYQCLEQKQPISSPLVAGTKNKGERTFAQDRNEDVARTSSW